MDIKSSNNVWTRHVHLPVPTCAFPSVFKEGSISSLAKKKCGKSAWHERRWLMTISAITLNSTNKNILKHWSKTRWTVQKKWCSYCILKMHLYVHQIHFEILNVVFLLASSCSSLLLLRAKSHKPKERFLGALQMSYLIWDHPSQ